jgi:hypothetical protein
MRVYTKKTGQLFEQKIAIKIKESLIDFRLR